MDFVTGLPISTDWKGETYDSILVITVRLTDKSVKVTTHAVGLAEVVPEVVVQRHSLPSPII